LQGIIAAAGEEKGKKKQDGEMNNPLHENLLKGWAEKNRVDSGKSYKPVHRLESGELSIPRSP
jgi:hypothetical protein